MSELLKAVARLVGLPVAPLPGPPALGVDGGRLKPCPETPNCVSSQSADAARAMPPIRGTGGREATMRRLHAALAAEPRAHVVEARPDYVHAAFELPVFRFVDDVEFLWSEAEGVLHFRSASRTGTWDVGVNRRRMARLRRRIERPA